MIKKGSQDVTQASGEVEKINIHTHRVKNKGTGIEVDCR